MTSVMLIQGCISDTHKHTHGDRWWVCVSLWSSHYKMLSAKKLQNDKNVIYDCYGELKSIRNI